MKALRTLRRIAQRRYIVLDPLTPPRGDEVGLLRAVHALAVGHMVCPVVDKAEK